MYKTLSKKLQRGRDNSSAYVEANLKKKKDAIRQQAENLVDAELARIFDRSRRNRLGGWTFDRLALVGVRVKMRCLDCGAQTEPTKPDAFARVTCHSSPGSQLHAAKRRVTCSRCRSKRTSFGILSGKRTAWF